MELPDGEHSGEAPSAPPAPTRCPIVELRQYTLYPGKRDVLIDLFDREFVESQEAVGMRVIGQFRDVGDPNRFVWLRDFRDMPSGAHSLKAFYGGARFGDHAAYERHVAALARSRRWRGEIADALARRLKGSPDVLKLSPTARSQLRA